MQHYPVYYIITIYTHLYLGVLGQNFVLIFVCHIELAIFLLEAASLCLIYICIIHYA